MGRIKARVAALLSLTIASTAAASGVDGGSLDKAARAVTAAGAYASVDRLAAPDFGGRLTGTVGYDAAARWAAEQLRAAGLTPVAEHPDFLQRFPVTLTRIDSSRMELLRDGEPAQELVRGGDYMPLLFSGTGDVRWSVAF